MSLPESRSSLRYALPTLEEKWGSVYVRRVRLDGQQPTPMQPPPDIGRVQSSYEKLQEDLRTPVSETRLLEGVWNMIQRKGGRNGKN